MTSRAVVLFARTPEAEAAAKRLPARAAALFEAMIAAWLRRANSAGATVVIACDRDARQRLSRIAPELARTYIDQIGCGFGERLANAAAAVTDFHGIVLAGIDAPPPADLERAFTLLESGSVDAAIAPAFDGGINCIAFTTPPLDLLRSFTMRDRRIAARCIRYFGRVYAFRATSDIDSIRDFQPSATPVAPEAPLIARAVPQRVISRPPPLRTED